MGYKVLMLQFLDNSDFAIQIVENVNILDKMSVY